MRLLFVIFVLLGIFFEISALTLLALNKEQVKGILSKRYNNDEVKVNVILKKLLSISEVENNLSQNTFTDESLEMFIDGHIKSYEGWFLPIRDSWNNFKAKAVQWYPHLSVFIEDFTENYLWRAKIMEYKIKELTESKQKFEHRIMPHVNKYAKSSTEGRKIIFEANLLRISGILHTDLNMNSSQIYDFMAENNEKLEKLCYNTTFLFRRELLKDAVIPKTLKTTIKTTATNTIIKKSPPTTAAPDNFASCVIFVNSEKEKYLESNDAEKLDAMKAHFADDRCAAREICSKLDPRTQKPGKKPANLRKELQPYIDWFNKVYDDKEQEDNENIKDELDESVFDSIEKALRVKKTYSDLKIDCLIDYMKRSRSVDKIYTSELLFNKGKLEKLIKPITIKYEELFLKV